MRQSLNIPAVKTLNNISVPVFIDAMHTAGFSSVWETRKKLGLSMILGGCGAKLEGMVALYADAAFANDGKYAPLKWNKKAAQTQNGADSIVQILSPEAII